MQNIKFSRINQFMIAFALFLMPLAGVYAACCAGHGGVASCNKSTGFQMCKDGTPSPSCKCTQGKSTTTTTPKSKAATTPAGTTTSPATTSTNKTKSKSTSTTTPATTTAPVTKTTPKSTSSAKGCCSNHGGVAQCNKATGYQMCKDGSQSPSCGCQ
ncbi:hypothetical protein BN59_01306 [Legionella massiliensis]|uniref:Uncharacterized protein n=1 Tax=Legionella massiliensis TaxID=1034943 RepID=A0A078KVJ9_9GAMM|nr:hypothetical protein [Legionella massiliensis]CDZ77027.1 hypothetical protein BN59_01306 [Legionella massiliensis]CEE12765.1 hypothetical protein BN1094_01306 [Legionella massiliensis]